MEQRIVTAILGGGQGSRLWPLTRDRAKPAVPLAGKFRLIDIPISNCLNTDINRIFVLTQFNTPSLHRHVAQTYRSTRSAAASSTSSPPSRRGTAGLVPGHGRRRAAESHRHFGSTMPRPLLILSGDQLYRMDFSAVLEQHRERERRPDDRGVKPSRERPRASGSCGWRTAASSSSSRSRRTADAASTPSARRSEACSALRQKRAPCSPAWASTSSTARSCRGCWRDR